jgi:nitric oxide reductase activation protein
MDITHQDKAGKEIEYAQVANTPIPGVGATKVALRRLLATTNQTGWSRREESGRLDRRALTRFAVGEENIFARREQKTSTTSVVQLLIDASGSTFDVVERGSSESRIKVFGEVATHLSKILDECGVTLGITAFWGKSKTIGINGRPVEDVTFVEVKGYRQSLRTSRAAISSIKWLSCGSTPDYTALKLVLEDLSAQKEQRKVLFFLTDVDNYNQRGAQHLDELAKRLGITIIGIGVGDADITKCFTHSANVKSVAEVFTQSFNKLLSAVK